MAGKAGGFFKEFVKLSIMAILGITVIVLAAMTGGLLFEDDPFGMGFGGTDMGPGEDTPEQNETEEGNESSTEKDIQDKTEVVDHELIRENADTGFESIKIVGTLENVNNETVSEAEVRVRFRGEDGFTGQIERTTVTDLSPGETWEFELSYSNIGESAQNITDYELRVLE